MALSADDLIPLLAKLSRAERIRLARLTLAPAATAVPTGDAGAYAAAPPQDDEFATDDADPLAWDADGWDGVG